MLRYSLLLLLSSLFASCLSDPDCVVTASSEVRISFEKISSDSARGVKFDRIEVSGTDSVFYVGDSVTVAGLPIDPDTYLSTFRLYYESQMDSVTVSYTRITRVISPSCGAFNYFQDLAVVSHSFPAAKVVNPQLAASDETNLIIKL